MSSDYTDVTPFQRLCSAWNEINNAIEDVPEGLKERLRAYLDALDCLLRDIQPDDPSAPVPLPIPKPRWPGGRSHGV